MKMLFENAIFLVICLLGLAAADDINHKVCLLTLFVKPICVH